MPFLSKKQLSNLENYQRNEERFSASLAEDKSIALNILRDVRLRASERVNELLDFAALAKSRADHLEDNYLSE